LTKNIIILVCRGEEVAYMITPRYRKIAIVGMGESIPTPPEGIKAQVVIIPSFDFIRENPGLVLIKILN